MKKLKAQILKKLYLWLEDNILWPIEKMLTSYDLCPYGTECKICSNCGKCTYHDPGCAGGDDD